MKRKLLKQIANEWRSNLWLVIELTVVSTVMWFVVDYLAIQSIILSTPMGIETDNCFLITTQQVPQSSEEFSVPDTTMEIHARSKTDILDRLRHHPDVDEAALIGYHSIPYSQNTWGSSMVSYDNADTLRISTLAIRPITPEYLTVFNVRGKNGETPQQLAEILRRDELLMTDNVFTYRNKDITDKSQEEITEMYRKSLTSDKSFLVGKRFYGLKDSIAQRVGAIIRPIKRTEYEMPNLSALMLISPDRSEDIATANIIVKVKPGRKADFKESVLRDATTQFRSGNMYVHTVMPLDDMRRSVQAEPREMVRNFVVIMVFLLISIFLGLLGTFWFRTQQRVSEIAIRKVNGATPPMIFRRLIGEGLLLLSIATVPALLFDWLLTHYELNNAIYGWDYFDPARFIISVVAVFLLMSLMIVAGIWFPAHKAMKIEPAIALKDE